MLRRSAGLARLLVRPPAALTITCPNCRRSWPARHRPAVARCFRCGRSFALAQVDTNPMLPVFALAVAAVLAFAYCVSAWRSPR